LSEIPGQIGSEVTKCRSDQVLIESEVTKRRQPDKHEHFVTIEIIVLLLE
jgi:hypothetical protein